MYSRTYGLAAAARDERQGRSGGEKKHDEQAAGQRASGRAGELTGDQLGGGCNSSVAATAAGRPPAWAVRPPAAAGRQLVVYGEKAKIIFNVKKIRKGERKQS